MDIRKFFTPIGNKTSQSNDSCNGSSKRKTSKKIIDSDEEDPLPSRKRKPQTLASDSDDDDIFIIKKKPEEKKTKNKVSPVKKSQPKVENKPKLKPASAKDFFGSSPVSQTKIPPKRKIEKTETSDNKDDDFEKTLQQLDDDYKPKKIKREDTSNSDLSLASKLASKAQLKKDEIKEKNTESQTKEKNSKTLNESLKEKYTKSPSKEKHTKSPSKEKQTKSPSKEKQNKSPSKEKLKKSPKKSSQHPKKSKSSYEMEVVKNEKTNEDNIKHEKTNEDNNNSMIEIDEKKKQQSMAYRKYLQRSGPKNHGAKPLPQGKPNCLQGLTFVITGVLDTIDRDETADLIKKYGGKVTTSVSRNTSYLVKGDEAGESKVKKAEQLGTKCLNEDELFALIEESAPQDTPAITPKSKKMKRSHDDSSSSPILSKFIHTQSPNIHTPSPNKKLKAADEKAEHKKQDIIKEKNTISSPTSKLMQFSNDSGYSSQSSTTSALSQESIASSSSNTSLSKKDVSSQPPDSQMWVDKYKPTSLKNIIGQQGDQSNAKKLVRWLSNWFSNHSGNKKLTKPGPWSNDKSGAFYRAALLSGPPGVGKTTTVQLACKELGFDAVEMNASDTRSKKLLSEEATGLLMNKSLAGFASGSVAKDSTSRNHVLVMDEVDGMAGNQDRGGVQELIGLIKTSKIPIICMCNDRNHPKIRSLANYCFDLRFYKPRVEQIRGAMMSVCFREGIKIKPEALDQVIVGSNQDVRQVLHHLSMWSADQKNLELNQVTKDANKAKKDMKMGPWDVVKKVFSESDHANMSIHDKVSLFFHDYSISPLFVQENYLKVMPHAARGNPKKYLKLVAETASTLADSDLIDKTIRSRTVWSLLPTQALFSSVLPGNYLEGHFSGPIEFPRWLGNNSRKNKFDRISQELHTHMRLRISGTKRDIITDYGSRLRDGIIRPLVKNGTEGVKESVAVMTSHDLVREDLDSLIELTSWPGIKDQMTNVESKVKSAFTRTLNKDAHMTPFSTGSAITKKKMKSVDEENEYGSDGIEEDNDEDSDNEDISKNAMIKPGKKSSAADKKNKDASKPSKSKGASTKGKKK